MGSPAGRIPSETDTGASPPKQPAVAAASTDAPGIDKLPLPAVDASTQACSAAAAPPAASTAAASPAAASTASPPAAAAPAPEPGAASGGRSPAAAADDGGDWTDDDADGAFDLVPCAPPPKRPRIVAKTSGALLTESDAYGREDAGRGARLAARAAAAEEAVAAAGPGDLAADLAARYGGYDGFTNPARIKRG